MKYKVLSPIKHNGKRFEVGSEITFKDEPTKVLHLLEAIPDKKVSSKAKPKIKNKNNSK